MTKEEYESEVCRITSLAAKPSLDDVAILCKASKTNPDVNDLYDLHETLLHEWVRKHDRSESWEGW